MKAPIYLSYPAAICAAGANPNEIWHSVITGNQKNIKKYQSLSGKEFFCGRIDDSLLSPVDDKYDCRIVRILNTAISQLNPLVEKLQKKYGSERIAVLVGSCDNSSETSLAGHRVYFENSKFDSSYNLEMQSADYPATFVKNKYGLKGPSCVFATACSSSASAIIKASQLIRSGIVDVAIAGGVDMASDTALLGFDALEAVSSEVSNPFSKNRTGITLGEGAAFFVLSKNKDDVKVENLPSVVLLGKGESADASHITAPLADGSGAAQAMQKALDDAAIKSTDIDYINFHGTGTHLNDSMEAKAVSNVFEKNPTVNVSSTKPLTGHTLGAAGALELSMCYLAIVNNNSVSPKEIKLPIHKWDGQKDPEMGSFNFVEDNSTFTKPINICMSNSFAFGGCNVSLIIGKENE